jgi:TonB family protein
MSKIWVIDRKSRLKLGIGIVVIIHLAMFYGFWNVKARQLSDKMVGVDIYAKPVNGGLSFYEVSPNAECVKILNEQKMDERKPLVGPDKPIIGENGKPLKQQPVYTPEPPLLYATAPKCKSAMGLPQGYEKLGAEGYVGLELNINHKGDVTLVDIDRSSGFPELDQAAVKQVAESLYFQPCKKGDTATACKQFIKYRWSSHHK